MGFRFYSKIAIASGVVLVAVVILEFILLTFYVKRSIVAAEIIERVVKIVTPSRNEFERERNQDKRDEAERTISSQPTIYVSAVVCGERTLEATTMLKSITIFTIRTVQIHVVAEDGLHEELKNIINQWPTVQSGQVMLKLYSLHFPSGENADEWKRLFKPCASQRLFLLDVLPSIDSVLYMDTDTLLLRPVDDIWTHFKNFDSSQLASMAPVGSNASFSWYPRSAHHPFFGKTGMNSGVMLMNLTRMRAFGWTKKILEVYHKYKFSIPWGDQDLLNILFHDHPGLLYVHTCDWNYRSDYCMYGKSNNCGPAKDNGISVIHANRGVFHNDKQVFFKAIYTAFRDFKPGENVKLLASRLAQNLGAVSDKNCGVMANSVLIYPKKLAL